ncbi:hypothetical protein IFM89_015912 [Coptis chinensis]|uniref:1-deoxy-D-xylulose-5-phosphate synthase n=1 Tax=Coptis chinensis TaxID=261450 RepID=A0A835HT58_9MAGN|nr:hypothetical protein IFM89_015912 [Coptis chinensis]
MQGVTEQLGGSVHEIAAKVDEYTRGMISGSGSSLFEELGVSKFDPATGKQFKGSSSTQSYTTYFAEALIAEADADKGVVAIHAAMGGGTGLNMFLRHFPTRCFDVGIAEQHAVTFAAGLACEGLKPFCAIYSSFLQRAYDQASGGIFHFKAGLVGADGPTPAGSFDVTFMACLPNMVVMAPSDEGELFHMVATAAAIDDRPSCFRYPRGNGIGVELPPGNKGIPLEVGKGRILIEGERVALLGYGTAVQSCVAAASLVEQHGYTYTYLAMSTVVKMLEDENPTLKFRVMSSKAESNL